MADWITVQAKDSDGNNVDPNPDGLYGSDAVLVEFTFAQNTTPSTRAAELEFLNPIAEEKNEYNPETPDGRAVYYFYQFGKRSANLSLVAKDSCEPSANSCSGDYNVFSNQNVSDTQLQPYTVSGSYNIDFTRTDPSNPVVDGNPTLYQQNADMQFRNYFTNNDLGVPYFIELTVESTSPWYLIDQDFWLESPAQYVGVPGVLDPYAAEWDTAAYVQPRTYSADDTLTPVTIQIKVQPNNVANLRTGSLKIVNRQGVENTINFTQHEYVLPNQPPIPRITNVPGPTCSNSVSTTYSGATSSDPDGVITTYAWTSPGSPSSGTNVTFFTTISAPANTNCFSNSSFTGPTLTVTDDRNASNSTTATLQVGSRVACEGGCTISTSGPSSVSFGSSATVTASISDAAVSGCPGIPASSITSTNPLTQGSPTCPGDTRTFNFSGGNSLYSCTGSQVVTYGTKPAAPSFSISGQTVTNSSGSQSFTATCGASSGQGISSQSISCSGQGSSNSGTLSFTLSASQGNSASSTCTCSATDNASPASCRQTNTTTATFTYTNPSMGWQCNGDGTCSFVAGGPHASQAACETVANCPPPAGTCAVSCPGSISVGALGQYTLNCSVSTSGSFPNNICNVVVVSGSSNINDCNLPSLTRTCSGGCFHTPGSNIVTGATVGGISCSTSTTTTS